MDDTPPAPESSSSLQQKQAKKSHDGKIRSGEISSIDRVVGKVEQISIAAQPCLEPLSSRDETRTLPSFSHPLLNRHRVLACCIMNFGQGINDGATGALLPYIQKHYHVGYAVVSLIFVTMAIGFVATPLFLEAVRARLGRARTYFLAQIMVIGGYICISCAPPFSVMVVAFFFVGTGLAMNVSLSNVFLANLKRGTLLLGFMHGSYGVGGTISPLIATVLVTSGHQIWSRYYLLPLSLFTLCLLFAPWSFRHFETEGAQTTTLSTRLSPEPGSSVSNEAEATIKPTADIRAATHVSEIIHTVQSPTILLASFFLLCYTGAEVSISGFIPSFLISSRDAPASQAGYVTSGFWGGITLGRFLLTALSSSSMISPLMFIYVTIIFAAVFEALVWAVPNWIVDAVMISLVGVMLGPIYPAAMGAWATRIEQGRQVGGLSFVGGVGNAGGAIAPFVTGLLSQVAGTWVLHPTVLVLLGIMLASWIALPRVGKIETRHKDREEPADIDV